MQRRYDRLVTVQRATMTQASDGSPIETWADIAYRIPAHVAPTRGSERFSSPQEVAEQEQTVTIRFHSIPSAYRPLTPKDRILYPVDGLAANVQAPATNLILDILSPDEVGRQVDLSIKCRRRADVTT
jgi:head-tail adaptor